MQQNLVQLYHAKRLQHSQNYQNKKRQNNTMCAARNYASKSHLLHGNPRLVHQHQQLYHQQAQHSRADPNRPGRSRSVQPDIQQMEEDCMATDDHTVPDGSKDVQKISYMGFIRMFMSGKLNFPEEKEKRDISFGIEDLKDLGEIGRGRFGKVNKMLHTPTGKTMAVKRVRLITSRFDDSEDTRLMRQLRNEVNTIKDASTCPEVVGFYGVTFYEGDCLICMELMDLSLDKLYKIVHNIAKEKFDENVLGIVGVTVLKALHNLKEIKKIIHRDVKPSNILLNNKGAVKLCDFGISGYLEDSIARTKDVGCRPYMAPERLTAAQEEYDIRTDVWSLGITLIETARGEFPYPNFNEQCIFAQIQQVVMGDPLFMHPGDNYSAKTVQFVNFCLTKEYLDRPTYEDLMDTDFYRHFSILENKEEKIREYIERMSLFDEGWMVLDTNHSTNS